MGWAALTAIGVFLDQGTTLGRILHDTFQGIGTVLFALGVGGGLLEVWSRTEWQHRTQWIVFDLLDQAIREVATLISHTVEVVTAPPDTGESVVDISGVFILPWSAV